MSLSHKKVLESFLSCCAVPKYEVPFGQVELFLWNKGTFFWDTNMDNSRKQGDGVMKFLYEGDFDVWKYNEK